MTTPSWNGNVKKSDVKTWSEFPMISSFSGNGFSITNLSSLEVSTINGASFPQVIPPSGNVADWSRFPMLSSFSGNGFSISNLGSLEVSTINGSSFPQVIPADNTSNWSRFPMLSSFSGNGLSISNLGSLEVSTINGSSFPQAIPADNTSNWSRFPMVSSFSGNGFSISNVSSLSVSSINGSTFPQAIPADNTSNWATFPARANVNMSNFSLVNLNQINGSNYPPAIPVQNPDRWSQYPAIQNVAMASFNLTNANSGQFNNQINVGGFFQTIINGGDITTRNITVSDPVTQQADVNIYGVNLAPADSALFVQGGTVLDGGGSIHGITIGTLPVSGVNTQRIDVLPTGISITTPTFFDVLGAGAISLNVAGAGNFAVGGSLSLAGGAYIEMNSSNVRMINTTSGNENTLLNVGVIDGPFNVSNSFPLLLRNSGGAGVELANVTFINGAPYPPSAVANLPTQTLLDVKANGTSGGDAINHVGTYLFRELNTGNPVLSVISFPIFESTTIVGMRLDTSNGAISIPAGTYLVDVYCPVISVGAHRCRIFDVTNSIVLAVGNNGYANNGFFGGDSSSLSAVIVIPSLTTIEIQQRVETNGFSPTTTLGLPNVFGDDEIYTTVRFVKIL
jgi:hypothetical protein